MDTFPVSFPVEWSVCGLQVLEKSHEETWWSRCILIKYYQHANFKLKSLYIKEWTCACALEWLSYRNILDPIVHVSPCQRVWKWRCQTWAEEKSSGVEKCYRNGKQISHTRLNSVCFFVFTMYYFHVEKKLKSKQQSILGIKWKIITHVYVCL